MSVTPNLIDKLEGMSCLSLDDSQKQQITAEIEQMLSFMDTIKDAKVDDKVANNSTELDSFVREDIVSNSLASDIATSNSKMASDGFFTVPKVVD